MTNVAFYILAIILFSPTIAFFVSDITYILCPISVIIAIISFILSFFIKSSKAKTVFTCSLLCSVAGIMYAKFYDYDFFYYGSLSLLTNKSCFVILSICFLTAIGIINFHNKQMFKYNAIIFFTLIIYLLTAFFKIAG